MQKTLLLFAVIFFVAASAQQGPKRPALPPKPKSVPLPANVYKTLRDTCTQLDIVFITGKGGSMSMDTRGSIRGFTSFVNTRAAEKIPNAPLDGTIMWQIDGRAYIMANLYFTGDSSAYLVFTKDDKEYVNALLPDGAGFLKNRGGVK